MAPSARASVLARVALVVSDVDGVVTDRRIVVSEMGEIRYFTALDGIGVGLARQAGLPIVWLSRKVSGAVERRAGELGVELFQGIVDKGPLLETIAARHGVPLARTAFLGDDVQDLAAFARVGCPVAVADAVREVRRAALFVTRARGGEGALRELVERILRAQGRWPRVLEDFAGVRLTAAGRARVRDRSGTAPA